MARRKAEVEQTTNRDGKMAAAGDRIDDDRGEHESTHNVAADQLRTLIERIERLMEEKSAVGADIKQVFGEAKGLGYDNKAIRRIIAIRAKDHGEYLEEEAILETYLAALGMI